MDYSVSVALATYNGERYIEEQVASVLQQTRPPDELIVADDGSADRTIELIRDVHAGSSVDLRILGSAGRLGVARNFERALSAARSDIIALSDQDDRWHPEKLERSVPSFEANPRLLLQHTNARLVGETGVPLGLSLFDAIYLSSVERDQIGGGRAFEAYVRRNLATGATTMIRRNLLHLAAPFPDGWLHDEWLAVVAAAVGEVELFDEQLVDYRQHGSNVIGVKAPTLRYRVKRMMEPRGDRYRELRSRSESLLSKLEQIGARSDALRLAREKARFEAKRATLSDWRLLRIAPIMSERRRGSYETLSSQGNLDVLRDILQPR